MTTIDNSRATIRRLGVALSWGALLFGPMLRAESLERKVEARWGKSFPHLVWTHCWATFAEKSRVAARLGCNVKEYETAVELHPWMLQPPPALCVQEGEWSRATEFGGGKQMRFSVADFVADVQGTPPTVKTRVELTANNDTLRLSFHCDEPNMDQVDVRTAEPADEFHRLVLDGDVHELYVRQRDMGQKTLLERIAAVPPRERSVFEDDCVFVRLTPLAPGEELSREFRVRDQRDAARLLRELGPIRDGDLHLNGTFYTVAINPDGLIHSSFYDPYEGGRSWCCWRPHARLKFRREANGWHVELSLPLEHFHPVFSRGAVWGVDIYRHRPVRGDQPEQLARTHRSVLLRFVGDGRKLERKLRAGGTGDEGDGLDVARKLRTSGVDEASLSKWSPMDEREEAPKPEARVGLLDEEPKAIAWPTPQQWQETAPLRPFRDVVTGQVAEAQTRVRLLESREYLFVRFSCERNGSRPLRVVTRDEELAALPKGHRGVNWIDRRESFGGPDWGDHVEIQLAPGLNGVDPFHNGYYLILVNSSGEVLSRYIDPFGAYSVDVEPWNPKARTDVEVRSKSWTVQVAIPFSSFFGTATAGRTWFANFLTHRGRSARTAWAATYGSTREPGSFGRLHLEETPRVATSDPGVPRFWPGVPADAMPPGPVTDRTRDRILGLDLTGNKMVAVGARGTVWLGSTTGDQWQLNEASTWSNLQAVQFVAAKRGWAVGGWSRDRRVALCGGMGTVLSTDDGGRSWQPQWEDKGAWLFDVCFVSEKTGYVCGGYGTVLKTIDGGRSWQGPLPTGTNAWLYELQFIDENTGWAVGQDETLLHTLDGGKTWQQQTADSFRRPLDLRERMCSVHFVDAQCGWAIGERGTVLSTTDGGEHWRRQTLPITDELVDLLEPRDIYFVDREVGWIVGLLGSVVLRTEDGGRNWLLARTGFRGGLCAVKAKNREQVWAVGERGAQLFSSDGGRTWTVASAADHPTWIFITPHDHHLNGWAGLMAATADQVDWVTSRPGRGAFYFEPYLDLYHQRWLAGTQEAGAVVIREWNDLLNSRRRQPHYVHHAYQLNGGARPLTLRLTALFRLVRPEAVFTECPVFAEGYWAWETALTPRCARDAYFAAGDPKQFPELIQLGLEPWQPAELFTQANWYNEAFNVRPATHVLGPRGGSSPRLGKRLDAVTRSAGCWEGLMDRATAQPRGWIAARRVHLVHRAREGEGISRPELDLEVRAAQ